jgi:predicted enzyme involved in methoxymalonyl-ACP biosynthesis
MGRQIEHAMAHLAVEAARAARARCVIARHLPTAKNRPCLEFWQKSGFEPHEDGHFVWDAREPYPLPEAVNLTRD